VPPPTPLSAHNDSIRYGPRSRIRITQASDVVIVALSGEHDISTVAELEASLAAVGTCTKVIVDLRPCAFIELRTAHALAAGHAVAAARGDQLVILLPRRHGPMARLTQLTGLAATVPCFETLVAATAGVRHMDAAVAR
jgi:anti-anti-sigma factor